MEEIERKRVYIYSEIQSKMQFNGKLELLGRGASMPLYPEGHARDDA
jgi:hypothetical protein